MRHVGARLQAAAVDVLMCDKSYADQAARGRGCAAHNVALHLHDIIMR